MSGWCSSRASRRACSRTTTIDELAQRGVSQPNPVYHVYDFNTVGWRPDRQGQTLVLHERPLAGAATEHAERLSQPERRRSERVDLGAVIYDEPAFSDRTWENYTPRITWQATQRNSLRSSGMNSRSAATARARLVHRFAPSPSDLARSGRPWRVQPAARPAGELDVAGDQQAAPRGGHRHHLLSVGRPRARSESHAESRCRSLESTRTVIVPGARHADDLSVAELAEQPHRAARTGRRRPRTSPAHTA